VQYAFFTLAQLPAGQGLNPLVLATFYGTETQRSKPRVLFYGHYDVIAAPGQDWDSDPFMLTGRSGYLYGRGASDNKGPIMAMAFAAAELLFRRSLDIDLVFLIEGEEECGSSGFSDTVLKHKDAIGRIDSILLSNSTWIAEEPPCVTYGLRGVVRVSLEISSGHPDMHSGIEGGAQVEPMLDMVKLLSTLTNKDNKVRVPGFCQYPDLSFVFCLMLASIDDQVRSLTEEEGILYEKLSVITNQPASALSARWREPALTIHNIEVSGPKNATVIPGTVAAQISIRIVPDQDLSTISKALVDHLNTSFQELNTSNVMDLKVAHTADWWLGSLEDPWFRTLEEAIEAEWGVEPLRIREGGSIPSIPFLEKVFGCHALHLPLGQSSDQAHLPNERISISHLHRGKSVLERFLRGSAERFTI
jgi:di- and tripeptidase